jgi:hypothetical protein
MGFLKHEYVGMRYRLMVALGSDMAFDMRQSDYAGSQTRQLRCVCRAGQGMWCVTGRPIGGKSGRREWWSTSLPVGEGRLLDDSAVSQVEERGAWRCRRRCRRRRACARVLVLRQASVCLAGCSIVVGCGSLPRSITCHDRFAPPPHLPLALHSARKSRVAEAIRHLAIVCIRRACRISTAS